MADIQRLEASIHFRDRLERSEYGGLDAGHERWLAKEVVRLNYCWQKYFSLGCDKDSCPPPTVRPLRQRSTEETREERELRQRARQHQDVAIDVVKIAAPFALALLTRRVPFLGPNLRRAAYGY